MSSHEIPCILSQSLSLSFCRKASSFFSDLTLDDAAVDDTDVDFEKKMSLVISFSTRFLTPKIQSHKIKNNNQYNKKKTTGRSVLLF